MKNKINKKIKQKSSKKYQNHFCKKRVNLGKNNKFY